MIGLGTIINVAFIILGGFFGFLFGKKLKESMQQTLIVTCGVATLMIGISGSMEGMLSITDTGFSAQRGAFCVVCLLLGAFVGELLDIEGKFEKFGEWLKKKTGNSKDSRFVDGFITASFTVCIGAMAIVGSIEDGISGDYSILLTKSILDLIIIMVMAASMGKGPVFSFIPVAILQGSVTLLARVIAPVLNADSLQNLSLVGSILIFCVGINLVFGKRVKVANLLPAVIFAVIAAYIPFSL